MTIELLPKPIELYPPTKKEKALLLRVQMLEIEIEGLKKQMMLISQTAKAIMKIKGDHGA